MSYEKVDTATAALATALALDDASGAVAVQDGAVVGYLLGAPKPNPVWGANVWVEAAGQALAPDTPAEMMRELYAVAATRWVEQGRIAQYVVVPATDDELVRAWFRLGFGQQHAQAIRSVPDAPPPPPSRVSVRRAVRADIPTLARLELELPRHQGLAPTFSAGTVGRYDETVAEWEEDFDSPTYNTFVAEHDGEVVGSAIGCSLEVTRSHESLTRPDHAGFLAFAAVLPQARGLGAGRALGEAVLAWAAEAGFECAVTDWRVTNLLSSRAWPALGFEETFLRLHRLIGY